VILGLCSVDRRLRDQSQEYNCDCYYEFFRSVITASTIPHFQPRTMNYYQTDVIHLFKRYFRGRTLAILLILLQCLSFPTLMFNNNIGNPTAVIISASRSPRRTKPDDRGLIPIMDGSSLYRFYTWPQFNTKPPRNTKVQRADYDIEVWQSPYLKFLYKQSKAQVKRSEQVHSNLIFAE